jgi:hypothetical protein
LIDRASPHLIGVLNSSSFSISAGGLVPCFETNFCLNGVMQTDDNVIDSLDCVGCLGGVDCFVGKIVVLVVDAFTVPLKESGVASLRLYVFGDVR